MSKTTRFLSAVAVAVACAALGYSTPVSAAVPASLTQQGRLLDSAGTPIDTDISFVFSIYAAATGGAALWAETQTVTVDQGYFSARLGETTVFPGTLFDGTKTLYLGIKIGSDGELAPRQLVNSVPFALHAADADLAANATHANMADTANSAATATSATTAAGVTSILTNFTQASGTGTTSATASCTAGFTAVGGGCTGSGQPLSVAAFAFPSGKGASTTPIGFTCGCPTCTSMTAEAACAK